MADRERAEAADPVLALGEFAALLADGSALPGALDMLADRLGLQLAFRDASGAVVTGEATGTSVEIPVHGRSGVLVGHLAVAGSHAWQLSCLRSAAAVLGLALAPGDDLLEADRAALADALHDGPVQALVVARYASDIAVRGGNPVEARDAVQRALVDARRFLWHLRPRGSNGLIDALDQLSQHLVEAGGTPIGVLGDASAASAVRGAPAVLVYRLVQAMAGPQNPPVRVVLRADGNRLLVDVDGAGELPDPERWTRRVRALGGDLTTGAGRVRLTLPRPDSRTTS